MKKNTALFICLAFVFRLFSVNIGWLPSFVDSEKSSSSTKQSYAIQESKYYKETAVQSNLKEYAAVEVFEEDSEDEENPTKANCAVILATLHSFIHNENFIPKSSRPFDLIKCELQPKKYLALSILRV